MNVKPRRTFGFGLACGAAVCMLGVTLMGMSPQDDARVPRMRYHLTNSADGRTLFMWRVNFAQEKIDFVASGRAQRTRGDDDTRGRGQGGPDRDDDEAGKGENKGKGQGARKGGRGGGGNTGKGRNSNG